MTIRSRFTLVFSAAAVSLALAAPAFAEEMGKSESMGKAATTNTMSNDKMGKDTMSKSTTTGMSKDAVTDKKHDAMSPPSGGMSK